MNKSLILFAIACFIAAVALAFPSTDDEEELDQDSVIWADFKLKNRKDYHRTEDPARKAIFLKRDRKIKEHNARRNKTFELAHNHLSDKTDEEMAQLLGAIIPAGIEEDVREIDSNLLLSEDRQAASLDLRTDPCLAPIKNQANCGSCWSFSAIASLEYSSCKKKGGVFNSLSEQQLVDCDTKDLGCGGGWPTNAWAYLKTTTGSNSASSYPYTAVGASCKSSSGVVKAQIGSYGNLPALNVAQMKSALSTYGPLAAAIQAQGTSFFSYKNGTYYDPTCPNGDKQVNHAVTIVGYSGNDYWIVRNSWGTGWGLAGYIYMKMGVNLCNIERYPMAVIASS